VDFDVPEWCGREGDLAPEPHKLLASSGRRFRLTGPNEERDGSLHRSASGVAGKMEMAQV
jgi:hypothetical protein